jgi:hypothetical protein
VPCLVAVLGLAGPAPAAPQLLAPTAPIGGRSQGEWTAIWWQTVLHAAPGTSLPEGGPPEQGDFGPVFLLAGGFGDSVVVRNVTIEEGKTLFFPLVNVVTTELDSVYGPTEAEMRQDAEEYLGVGSNLFVDLDGTALPLPAGTTSLNDFRIGSPLFQLVSTPDNLLGDFGVPPGPVDAVAVGYWAAVSGLTPGQYTLRFGGTATATGFYENLRDPFSQDITYNLTITAAVPEPASVVMLLVGGVVSTAAVARRRRAAV